MNHAKSRDELAGEAEAERVVMEANRDKPASEGALGLRIGPAAAFNPRGESVRSKYSRASLQACGLG